MQCYHPRSQRCRAYDCRNASTQHTDQPPKKIGLILVLFLLLSGCNPSHPPSRFEGVAMTMAYSVQIGQELSQEEETAIEAIILSTFSEVHSVYNNWNPDSEISALNRLSANKPVTLSPKLAAVLDRVDKLVKLTDGRFDPTVEPLQHLWKKNLSEGHVPSADKLKTLSQAVGWNKIHLKNGLFWKDHALTALDLGGFAKGYAVDLITEKLKQAGYHHVFVEWGGEIRTLGHHPSGRPWTVSIIGASTEELQDEAIATSGNYLQNWTVEGVNYTHIIDPKTKLPLHDCPISSVTVIAPTCAEADGIATALMLFTSKEQAQQWAEEKGMKVLIW